MPSNGLPPAWVQLNYTSNSHSHRALLPCSISGSPVAGLEPDLVVRVGAAQSATTCVAALVSKLKAAFHTTDTFDNFYVFSQPTPSDPVTFIYTGSLAIAGTNAAADQNCCEAVFTFKTPRAGGLKLYLMESVYVANTKGALPGPSMSVEKGISDFITGDDDWVIGRNGDFPLIGLFITTKLNDHLRRKYLL